MERDIGAPLSRDFVYIILIVIAQTATSSPNCIFRLSDSSLDKKTLFCPRILILVEFWHDFGSPNNVTDCGTERIAIGNIKMRERGQDDALEGDCAALR